MGIYVAYVMYYVDYPRKRSFYVHLKETVQVDRTVGSARLLPWSV